MRRLRGLPALVVATWLAAALPGAAAAAARPDPAEGRRPVAIGDLFALRDVKDPQIAPDGVWVAYTVSRLDADEDRADSDVWMTRWDGSRSVRLTTSPREEHTPRFSPDDRHVAFLSDRDDPGEKDQIWILDRAGGEAERVTDFRGGVTDFDWSPDGRRLALVARDPEADELEPPGAKKRPRPVVVDRFQFKQDKEGYLGDRRQHIYLLDLAARATEALTPGPYNELLPSWSPDGSTIAFVTKRGADFDRHNNWDVYLVEARPGARARRLTTGEGPDCDPELESRPAWSPDGRSIAFPSGGAPELIWYAVTSLAVVPVGGGPARAVVPGLDRNIARPRFSADGAHVYFLLEDDGSVHLARTPAAGGEVERLTAAGRVVEDFDIGPEGRVAILTGTPLEPFEVTALETKGLRPLSDHNRTALAGLRLGAVERIEFASRDRTPVHGFVVLPPDSKPGQRHPAILRIHGGPVSQYASRFMFEWQLFAAHGYAVVAANPRGSSGRGEAFQKAIRADWGNRDAQDVLAAIDHVVARGIADPKRLGIGGWSYGGMLTNYTIARDTRFKAATSGAGISNILAGYGTDQYVREYELELGVPWRSLDVWLRNSFPFLHADRIVTPTLFLCGEKDSNVPLLNSEQMYQALRSLGIDTRLVIYPGEYHSIARPSFQRDRLERYLDWYDRHLRAAGPARP